MRAFVGGNLMLMGQSQRDIIQAFEQAFFREWLDLKMGRPAEFIGYRLRG